MELLNEGFESGGFAEGGWINEGCYVQEIYRHQGTYAARLNSTNKLTKVLSTAGKTGITVEYARYIRNCESDDNFYAEWYDGSGWNLMETVAGNSEWAIKIHNLPIEAENNPAFELRFRFYGGAADYVYLDEIKIVADQ
jgi:hypothetical protein